MKTLITGANKGIGFALAQNLGHRGYEVLVGARNETRGQEAVEKLKAEGINAEFVKVDLDDLNQLTSLSALTDIDLLINNAGISGNIHSDKGHLDMEKSAFDYSTTDLEETIKTNFLGTHAVIKELLPHSLTENAKIINITVPVSQEYWMPLAYVTSKKYLPGRKFFIGLSVFTMFFAGGLIPNYLLIKSLGWMNTMWAVTVPGALSIFNMLIMKSFFESMPDALEEAAIIDGATPFQILMRIILPLSKPILATMVLFYAVGAWNAWFGAFLYMDNKNLFPVSVYLRNLVKGATGAEAQSADEQSQVSSNIKAVTMVLTVLPVLIVYPFCQKYFVNGIMIGSVKG